MKIMFIIYDDANPITEYATLTKDNNYNSFYLENLKTTIKYKFENDTLYLKRTGLSKQDIIFKLNERTKSHFSDNLGFEEDFTIETTKLIYNEKGFFVCYNLLIDNEFISNHKIYLKII